MKVTIEKRKNHDHIVTEEFMDVYEEHERVLAKEETERITEEYESYLDENDFDLDQDAMNNIEATTNLHAGEYEFDCGDFTYYITIEE